MDDRVREALTKWYEPSTLNLLENTPINCLLVTFSIGAPSEAEASQHQLIKEYALAARKRGVAVLGIVYPGAASRVIAAAAADAQLDGLVLDGEFPAEFSASLARQYPVVGRNCVCTDGVAMATIGYNPRAGHNEAPFRLYKNPKDHPADQLIPPGEYHQYADNTVMMGEAAGLGTADLSKIDLRGVPIKEVMWDYEAHWKGQAPV